MKRILGILLLLTGTHASAMDFVCDQDHDVSCVERLQGLEFIGCEDLRVTCEDGDGEFKKCDVHSFNCYAPKQRPDQTLLCGSFGIERDLSDLGGGLFLIPEVENPVETNTKICVGYTL